MIVDTAKRRRKVFKFFRFFLYIFLFILYFQCVFIYHRKKLKTANTKIIKNHPAKECNTPIFFRIYGFELFSRILRKKFVSFSSFIIFPKIFFLYFILKLKQASVPVVITSVLNRKNGFAVGKIGAKVAVAQSHEEQLL